MGPCRYTHERYYGKFNYTTPDCAFTKLFERQPRGRGRKPRRRSLNDQQNLRSDNITKQNKAIVRAQVCSEFPLCIAFGWRKRLYLPPAMPTHSLDDGHMITFAKSNVPCPSCVADVVEDGYRVRR